MGLSCVLLLLFLFLRYMLGIKAVTSQERKKERKFAMRDVLFHCREEKYDLLIASFFFVVVVDRRLWA